MKSPKQPISLHTEFFETANEWSIRLNLEDSTMHAVRSTPPKNAEEFRQILHAAIDSLADWLSCYEGK